MRKKMFLVSTLLLILSVKGQAVSSQPDNNEYLENLMNKISEKYLGVSLDKIN